jgi:mRNA deadenylase 3'-5' endonuclease subunit Ccr4
MKKNYNDYVKNLEKKGYKCTFYGDNSKKQGLSYYETEKSVLKITYEWLKVSENNYKAGNIIDIEDVTTCYR